MTLLAKEGTAIHQLLTRMTEPRADLAPSELSELLQVSNCRVESTAAAYATPAKYASSFTLGSGALHYLLSCLLSFTHIIGNSFRTSDFAIATHNTARMPALLAREHARARHRHLSVRTLCGSFASH